MMVTMVVDGVKRVDYEGPRCGEQGVLTVSKLEAAYGRRNDA